MSATGRRIDAVFIRKSSQGQDEQGQIRNVETMLQEATITVPKDNWFIGTVKRRNVRKGEHFKRLMDLVNAGQVRTVFVESQDRWGTADRTELYALLEILRSNDTRLYDLKAKRDLTEKDLATEMLSFIGSIKSQKELEDLAYRSLRTRVNNFKDNGSWPTGTHPFGFGKACYRTDGKLLWVWQPVNRSLGQIFMPDTKGKLQPGPENVRLTRKSKGDRIVLVPSNKPTYVKAVRLVYELYTRVGLSRRAISARLNAEGYRFYSRALPIRLLRKYFPIPRMLVIHILAKRGPASFIASRQAVKWRK